MPQFFEKTSRSNLFMRLRITAFPCFLESAIPMRVSLDGKYINVRDGEKILFPLLNSFENSLFFFIL